MFILGDDEMIFGGFSPNGNLIWHRFKKGQTKKIQPEIYTDEANARLTAGHLKVHSNTNVSVIPLEQWISENKGE